MKAISLILILTSVLCFSQNKQLLYGFSEIPQSLLSNPGGKVTNTGYFGIPFLSHFHVNGGSSGATVYDLFAADGVDFSTKFRRVVYDAKPGDFFTANQQLEIVSGGFAIGPSYNKNQYLSFGVYQEFDFITYFPKDIAVLALEGNQANIGRRFDVSSVSASAEVIAVWHVGYNKKVNDKFTYGARGKIYSSIINATSNKNEGYFTTVLGGNNFYQHIFNLDTALRTSGYALNGEDNAFEPKDILTRTLLGGNLGLGFDVGFTYNLDNQWTFDASLQDVGFIRHSKEVENYEVKGELIFEGVDPIFFDTNEGDTADEFYSEIEDEFEDLFDTNENSDAYTTWRPIKFNASLNYAFGKKRLKECNCLAGEQPYMNRVGAQLYAIKRPKSPQLALTAYYYRRLFNGLRMKATYTLDSYSFNNIGLGVSAHLGGANFYVLADNFLQYQNIYDAQSVSLQLGFNYIFNNK
ncbi:hypothetical protein FPF71_04675 [Algibacter amylolyticus]|uniref:DUF5723 domain-containing protein n=1 Tax=Algibacter amylolyticus TaxID=1608400 RepID=A0A5M7BLF6_9FLAO|nr:DUF5723 family protein [Algibacter amylolyticus]KAA5828134.1 hypothetical protein F2B50_04675 [Algibacter amylolyticus]MBB5267383.1 hypothetical protein [Algibacter amylolyticus]TSJ82379.1 hypothetical protein FPF71_04675 [Algibacter amylolyticus]